MLQTCLASLVTVYTAICAAQLYFLASNDVTRNRAPERKLRWQEANTGISKIRSKYSEYIFNKQTTFVSYI